MARVKIMDLYKTEAWRTWKESGALLLTTATIAYSSPYSDMLYRRVAQEWQATSHSLGV